MKLKIAVILAVMAAAALLGLQRVAFAQNPAGDAVAPSVSNLRILAPNDGQRFTQNFVAVQHEMVNPAAAASPTPTFQLQLDAADPVRTASIDYTFTGLAPGQHTVMVELVDANSTPVMGSRRFVHFTVVPPANPGAATPAAQPRLQPAALQSASEAAQQAGSNPGANRGREQDKLPATGSALPLLSVIGFGVLLGGIACAMKTR